MAILKRKRRGSWLLFGIRALGVVGLFAALIGAVGARANPSFSFRATFPYANTGYWTNPDAVTIPPRDAWALVQSELLHSGSRVHELSMWLLVGGTVAALVSLLLVLLGGLGRLAGRRNITASNATLQTVLAAALLIGINVYSFQHYKRYDWTTGKQFTLDPAVVKDLQQLRGETTVVVYQRHKTFGQLNDKPDAFDYAAERKVVEKVQDLVSLFREFGPQFRVEVLDVEDEGYTKKLEKLTKDNPRLAKALDAAPENSIFFHARREVTGPRGDKELRESVQRLSFNDFYQLDKTESQKTQNLVLVPQGVSSFARRVLAIEEKKPKIAVATIHEVLSTNGEDFFGMAGVRKTLELYGFEVVDIVLKKWGDGEPTSAAQTFGEAQLERLESDLAESDAVIAINKAEYQGMAAIHDKLKSNLTIDELNRELRPILQGQRMTPESRKRNIEGLGGQLDMIKEIISLQEKDRAETLAQLEKVPDQERIIELRRLADVQAKFSKLLADCDMVIVPRMTVRNVAKDRGIPAWIYRLDLAQTEALKQFMAAGKPVFALFGPTNEAPGARQPGASGPDTLEAMLAQLGIVFGNQVVLYNSETKAFSQRRAGPLAAGGEVEIPPVWVDRPKDKVRGQLNVDDAAHYRPNAISNSLKIIAAATGSTDTIAKLTIRNPRPVYYLPVRGPQKTVAEFLYADPESWNEADPYPTREKTPRYEPTKPDSPLYGTRDAKRRGPFPIGVAIETTVPAEWRGNVKPATMEAALLTASAGTGPNALYALAAQALTSTDRYAGSVKPQSLRVAAIGQGGVFSEPELSPAKEQFLLQTCNWLLGRDERLPHDAEQHWHYPRVTLSPRRLSLWRNGTLIVMPAALAFLGALVLLVRKYR